VHTAVEVLCERLRDEQGCGFAALSCVQGNDMAWALYASLGFEATGEMEDDEPVARRPL
jgi:RimJ/RimL family protein N-acetyltransferase